MQFMSEFVTLNPVTTKKLQKEEMKMNFDFSQLYIVDFVKSLGKKKNIFAVIYLVLNVALITLLMQLFVGNFWLGLLFGILLYAITATIALSPVGEWMFRAFNGCKQIKDPEILNRLNPLFQEVKARAQAQRTDCIIDDKIKLYIREDDSINAFAMGRRTICVNRGLLALSDEQIKAVLGHEFGHLATHDTDLTLLITVGNFIVTAIITFIRVVLVLYSMLVSLIAIFCGEEGAFIRLMNSFATFMTTLFINGFMWLWSQLGILLVMKTSRDAEFEADAFACDLGYSEGLLTFFRALSTMESRAGLKSRGNIFAALAASHPATDKRIAKIESRSLTKV